MGYKDNFEQYINDSVKKDSDEFELDSPEYQKLGVRDGNANKNARKLSDMSDLEKQYRLDRKMWMNVDFTGELADRIFKNKYDLARAMGLYLEYCDRNPIIIKDIYGKNNQKLEVEHYNAPTIEGFCGSIGLNSTTFYDYAQSEEYARTIDIFQSVIKGMNISQAMAGAISPNLVSRYHGISDKRENVNTNQQVTLYVPEIELAEEIPYYEQLKSGEDELSDSM
jgi:hypothetical protein